MAPTARRGQFEFVPTSQAMRHLLFGCRCLLVCTGWPFASRSLSRSKSFLAMTELGYLICWVPLLLTTSAALYGLLMSLYRDDAHQASTSLICDSYRSSSAEPVFWDSGSSWKASAAVVKAEKGLDDWAMRAVVDMARRKVAREVEALDVVDASAEAAALRDERPATRCMMSVC